MKSSQIIFLYNKKGQINNKEKREKFYISREIEEKNLIERKKKFFSVVL